MFVSWPVLVLRGEPGPRGGVRRLMKGKRSDGFGRVESPSSTFRPAIEDPEPAMPHRPGRILLSLPPQTGNQRPGQWQPLPGLRILQNPMHRVAAFSTDGKEFVVGW
jgi:hypothetical protein